MSKPLCIVSCPIDTFSGYGARSRDFVKSLIKNKGEEWDIKIISQRWGQTPFGALNTGIEEDTDLKNRIIGALTMNLSVQPEVWIQITVPNEFQPLGKFNIGVTAGIETTIADAGWIEGCNRMDLNLVSSEHSKTVFKSSSFEKKTQTGKLSEREKQSIDIESDARKRISYYRRVNTNWIQDISIDTEASAASDDLDTITATNYRHGDLLVIQAANSARTVVVKDSTGNINAPADISLDHAQDKVLMIWDGSNWQVISSSNNS